MKDLWEPLGYGSIWNKEEARKESVPCFVCGRETDSPYRFKNYDTGEVVYVCGSYGCQQAFAKAHQGRKAHERLFVAFSEGSDGSPLCRIRGRVSFPERGSKLRPNVGEVWEVEIVGENDRQTVNFLRPIRRVYRTEEWESFGSPAKPRENAIDVGTGKGGPWSGYASYTRWALPKGWREKGEGK